MTNRVKKLKPSSTSPNRDENAFWKVEEFVSETLQTGNGISPLWAHRILPWAGCQQFCCSLHSLCCKWSCVLESLFPGVLWCQSGAARCAALCLRLCRDQEDTVS
jgi:hypothetical protein